MCIRDRLCWRNETISVPVEILKELLARSITPRMLAYNTLQQSKQFQSTVGCHMGDLAPSLSKAQWPNVGGETVSEVRPTNDGFPRAVHKFLKHVIVENSRTDIATKVEPRFASDALCARQNELVALEELGNLILDMGLVLNYLRVLLRVIAAQYGIQVDKLAIVRVLDLA